MTLDSGRAEPSHVFVALHLLACSVTWGSSFLLIKLLGGSLSPVVLASIRALGAAAVLMVFVLAMGRSILPQGREWRDWLVLGTVNGWLPNILVAFALMRMDSGPSALIQAAGPVLTAILAHFILAGERLTPAKSVGIVIGLMGVGLLIGPKALAGGGSLLAVLAMLLLTLGYAMGNVYARTIPQAEPVRLALGQQTVSAIVATLIAVMFFGVADFAPALDNALLLVALSVFSTALPIWIFMRLITTAGPTKAAMTGYLVPTVAVILGIVVLGEPIVPRQILGGVIVFVGVAIVTGVVRLPWRRVA